MAEMDFVLWGGCQLAALIDEICLDQGGWFTEFVNWMDSMNFLMSALQRDCINILERMDLWYWENCFM